MASPVTDPAWQAARNGFPADAAAVNEAAQVGQFLATHGIIPVYPGTRQWTVASTSSPVGTQFTWLAQGTLSGSIGWLPESDLDQPVVLPGGMTAIGRIEVAVQAIGAGADLQVTLYPDNGSGSPNTASPIVSAIVPASHITSLQAAGSLTSAGPLATAQSNTALIGSNVTVPWAQPAVSANGSGTYGCPVTSGNYTVFLGGYDATAAAAITTVAEVAYAGGGTVSGTVPLPSLPQAAWFLCAAATPDTMVAAGGINQSAVHYSTVWAASWDPSSGSLGAWSAQQSLPQATINGAMTCYPATDTVYVTGGCTAGSNATATDAVWYSAVTSGQISAWTAGLPLPQAVNAPYAAVIGSCLIVAGGITAAGTVVSSAWYAQLDASGNPGPWRAAPSLPAPAYAFSPNWNLIVTDSAMVIVSGTTTGSAASPCTMSLTVSPDGPAPEWQLQDYSLAPNTGGAYQMGAYPSGIPGQWEAFGFQIAAYTSAPLYPVPMISVPLPATGLTPGSTYHVVLHQVNGDAGLNNYLQAGELGAPSPPGPWLYSARGSGGPWSSHMNRAVCLSVYDQAPGGPVLHLWEDSGARFTSLVRAGASGQLLGALEATQFPAGAPEPVLGAVTQVTWDATGTIPTGTVQLA